MATTGVPTNRDIITDAFRKIGVVAEDEPMQADTAQAGLRALNRMLKAWQNHGHLLWTVSSQDVTLVAGPMQTLDPVRPIKIQSARFLRPSSLIPMHQMTRAEYDILPNKSVRGIPTQFYYDRQREAARLYVWPTTDGGETVSITYEREIEDQTDLNGFPDVPSEWFEAVVYGLAARLADDYSQDATRVIQRAEVELNLALAADREGSVYFGCADDYG